MLRGYTDTLVSRLLQAFPADRSYARVEFSRDPMPTPVAHFLAQTLQSRLDIELDRHRSIRSDWFDYDHPDVQHAQLTFGAMLGQHAHIPKSEWARLLGEAVHTMLSYLVRPVPTLVEFLFDEDEAVPVRDVYRGLAFFGPYPYLREVATSYLRQKNVQEVERSRFLAVLRHSDREITHDYDSAAWLRLLTPLFGMIDTGSGILERSVPVELIDAFFEDKGCGPILVRLRDVSKDPGHRITEDELRELLDEPARPLVQPPSVEPKPAVLPERAKTAPTEEPSVAPARPEIHQIIGPPREERPVAPLVMPPSEPAPEEAPEIVLPAARVERIAEQPAQQQEAPIGQETPTAPRVERTAAPADQPKPAMERPKPIVERPKPAAERPAPVERTAPPAAPPDLKRPQPPSQAPGTGPAKGVPLWQQFQKGAKPAATPAGARAQATPEAGRHSPTPPPARPVHQAVQPPARPASTEPQAGSKGVPLWQQFRKPQAPQAPAAPARNLGPLEETVLGESDPGDRMLYVRELFSGSVAEYERVLRRLQTAASWSHASQIIAEEVFRKHQVNIYSEAAITFTNAVEAQYRR